MLPTVKNNPVIFPAIFTCYLPYRLYLRRKLLLMRLCLIFTFSIFTIVALCQTPAKRIAAVKISHSIKIDGNLEESEWKLAPEATDFITNSPVYGKPSSRKTIVKILYDNAAVYVGAYLYDSVKNIRKQFTARDVIDRQDIDFFLIGFDTYHDRQNAFVFRITAAGVQGDARESQNGSTNGGVVLDGSWDAVWESKVSIKKDGWVAEVRIPFSAIRFPKRDVQDWGLNFGRMIRSKNELSIWNPEDPAISGDVNQWGDFTGLKNITPPLRLSILPYLSGGFRTSPTNNGNVTETIKNGGMDVKYGINESFTLDMTLVPDFAQVQSDNVYLNLTPFEVKFDDYRPFFTEGTELFNKAGLFYSRRIGARPGGADAILNFAGNNANYTLEKNPGITRLYNATKFSGRTDDNLGIGFFNAVSVPMYAKLRNNSTGFDSTVLTEPLTNYNILVFDKTLKHRSSISFTNSNVIRKSNSRNANVSSADVSLFDKRNKYNFLFSGKFSSIWGNAARSNGYATSTSFNKVSGLYRYSFGTGILSDTYNPNDLGFLLINNTYNINGSFGYYKLKPTKKFLQHTYVLRLNNNYLYKPFSWADFQINANAYFLFRNFYELTLAFQSKPIWYNDYYEPRTMGKVLKRTPYYYLSVSGGTDSRKKWYFRYLLGGAESPLPKDPYWNSSFSLRYRFNDRFQLTTSMDNVQDRGNWGYSFRNAMGEPIIARRNLKTSTYILAAQYGFTQRMTWTMRLRHNWTNVANTNFYTLKNDGYWDEIAFVNGRNRNTNFFNVDMFYTWDFLLGSRLTLAWKNALGTNVSLDPYTNKSYLKNFGSMFNNPHSNEVTLKIVYYLDYLKLRNRK